MVVTWKPNSWWAYSQVESFNDAYFPLSFSFTWKKSHYSKLNFYVRIRRSDFFFLFLKKIRAGTLFQVGFPYMPSGAIQTEEDVSYKFPIFPFWALCRCTFLCPAKEPARPDQMGDPVVCKAMMQVLPKGDKIGICSSADLAFRTNTSSYQWLVLSTMKKQDLASENF